MSMRCLDCNTCIYLYLQGALFHVHSTFIHFILAISCDCVMKNTTATRLAMPQHCNIDSYCIPNSPIISHNIINRRTDLVLLFWIQPIRIWRAKHQSRRSLGNHWRSILHHQDPQTKKHIALDQTTFFVGTKQNTVRYPKKSSPLLRLQLWEKRRKWLLVAWLDWGMIRLIGFQEIPTSTLIHSHQLVCATSRFLGVPSPSIRTAPPAREWNWCVVSKVSDGVIFGATSWVCILLGWQGLPKGFDPHPSVHGNDMPVC